MSPNTDQAYDIYTQARQAAYGDAFKALSADQNGRYTDASAAKANEIQNQAGLAALAKIGYTMDAGGNLVQVGAPNADWTAAQAAAQAAADKSSGYRGLENASANSGQNLRLLMETASGHALDYSKPGEYDLSSRAVYAMYGNIGANLDARDWKTIMASSDPLKAAEDALKAMYNDPAYLVANAAHLLTLGYLPEQADFTYKQMENRVGSTYNPNWTAGSQFEGKVDTPAFLASLEKTDKMAAAGATPQQIQAVRLADDAKFWQKWGGNPTLKNNAGVVNTGGTSTNSVFTPPTTPGAAVTNLAPITGAKVTPAVVPGGTAGTTGTQATTGTMSSTGANPNAATTPSLVTGLNTPGLSTGTPGAPGTTTLTVPTGTQTTNAMGTAGFTAQGNATPLNPVTGKPTTGLINGANTLTPGTFNVANTSTGNVNNGGLISGVAQQLYTQNAQAGLPTGVTPQMGYLGNSTAGPGMTPYNPYGFQAPTLQQTNNQVAQNWYNPKTGQRWTAPAAGYAAPSADWKPA